MAKETTALMEIGTTMNGLVFDAMAKNVELLSASLQASNKLLQDALEVGAANIAAGRKFLETVQRASLETSDAMIELGRANVQGFIRMTESLQKINGGVR